MAWAVSDTPYTYEFSGSEAVVRVRSKDRDGVSPFVLELFNADGVLAESLESDWVADEYEQQPMPWNGTLSDLFEAARRAALDIDRLTTSLLRDLDSTEHDL